jgi:hypothetical protein
LITSPSFIFSPTLHKSAAAGGFVIEGPGPEIPPPIEIIVTLTPIPNAEKIPDIKKTCLLRGHLF